MITAGLRTVTESGLQAASFYYAPIEARTSSPADRVLLVASKVTFLEDCAGNELPLADQGSSSLFGGA